MGGELRAVAASTPINTANTLLRRDASGNSGSAVVLVNAVKEQQAQIGSQQKQINEQQTTIKQLLKKLETYQTDFEILKKLVCSQNSDAEFCRPTIARDKNIRLVKKLTLNGSVADERDRSYFFKANEGQTPTPSKSRATPVIGELAAGGAKAILSIILGIAEHRLQHAANDQRGSKKAGPRRSALPDFP